MQILYDFPTIPGSWFYIDFPNKSFNCPAFIICMNQIYIIRSHLENKYLCIGLAETEVDKEKTLDMLVKEKRLQMQEIDEQPKKYYLLTFILLLERFDF